MEFTEFEKDLIIELAEEKYAELLNEDKPRLFLEADIEALENILKKLSFA